MYAYVCVCAAISVHGGSDVSPPYIQILAPVQSVLFVQMVKMGCLKELRSLFHRLSRTNKDRIFLHSTMYVKVRYRPRGMLIPI